MHGICFDYDLQDWFDFKIPKTKISPDFIYNCLEKEQNFTTKPNAKFVWIGGKPQTEIFTKSKKGNSWEMTKLTFHFKSDAVEITLEKDIANWLVNILPTIAMKSGLLKDIKQDFETHFEDFELFWFSKPMKTLRDSGLLIL